MRKPAFAYIYAKTKTQIRCTVTAQLISAFVFSTWIVRSLFYLELNPKFKFSSNLLWLYSQVCVGPDRKPRRPLFSQLGSYIKSKTGFARINMFSNFYFKHRLWVLMFRAKIRKLSFLQLLDLIFIIRIIFQRYVNAMLTCFKRNCCTQAQN